MVAAMTNSLVFASTEADICEARAPAKTEAALDKSKHPKRCFD
jgi:hypothetical protein